MSTDEAKINLARRAVACPGQGYETEAEALVAALEAAP